MIGILVSLEEIEGVLKNFSKEKSPGSDKWIVELFLTFFDIIGSIFCMMVEEYRRSGKVSVDINDTYIALIPKFSKPKKFLDFKPISLCNLVYKIISKIISNKIKRMIEEKLPLNQFGFLADRQIHDAISISQEAIHSIKSKKMKALVLKMGLHKDLINSTGLSSYFFSFKSS